MEQLILCGQVSCLSVSAMQTVLLCPVSVPDAPSVKARSTMARCREGMKGESDYREARLQMKGGQMRARPLMTPGMPWGEATRMGPSSVPNSATAAASTIPCTTAYALQSC